MVVSLEKFERALARSGLVGNDRLRTVCAPSGSARRHLSAETVARSLVEAGDLTSYQAGVLLEGRSRGLVLGNYILLDKLGEGGMGVVFKARHRRMDRLVALKVLPPSATQQPGSVERFQKEVRAAGRLCHPNIVTAYDADEAIGVHFLVTEYVEGKDLAVTVDELGPLPVVTAMDYVLQAARGLQYAHRLGVIHRDIKPSNLLIDRYDTIKILDMGMARFVDELDREAGGDRRRNGRRSKDDLTQYGRVLGTAGFMPPEQALDSGSADHRADIYSLGCTLFYLLHGTTAYDGATLLEKIEAHRKAAIPSLRAGNADVPEGLEQLFQRMLAKNLDDRPQSMDDVVSELELLLVEWHRSRRNGQAETHSHRVDELRSYFQTRLAHLASDVFFLGDSAPDRRLSEARRTYLRLLEDETLLALYDDTLDGSGRFGHAWTTRRLHWKDEWDRPCALPYSDLLGPFENFGPFAERIRLTKDHAMTCCFAPPALRQAILELLAMIHAQHHPTNGAR